MADSAFSPEGHRLTASRYFDDLTVGEQFYIPSRTMTEALFAAFQLASADNHPIHYDRVYCQAHGHRDLLAHGLLVAAQAAAGAGIFPHVIGDSLIAFLDQSSRFLRPVYVGRHALPHADDHRAQAGPHDRRRRHEGHHPQSVKRAGDGWRASVSPAQARSAAITVPRPSQTFVMIIAANRTLSIGWRHR